MVAAANEAPSRRGRCRLIRCIGGQAADRSRTPSSPTGTALIPSARHPHYEPEGPATRLDSQGNWVTARTPALGSLSHTCIERTYISMFSPNFAGFGRHAPMIVKA
jgi:hypothetical protein